MGEPEDDMGHEESASILLVDDSPEKLLALETVLESLGQRLVRASSGREALRCLMGGEFAVIILDINMPGMDGFETAELIRQRKSFDQTPIIFVTAFADEMHAAHGYELGAVDFIVQPVIPDVLRTKVGVFVDLFRKNRQVRRQADSLERRATQLHKLAAASLAINRALTLDQTLTVVADAARDIIGTEIAVAQVSADLKLESVNEVVSISDEGDLVDAERWNEAFANLTRSVRELNKPRRLSPDQLAAHLDETPGATGIIDGGWLAAPFTSRGGHNIGVLQVVHKHEGQLVDDDEALLVQLAQFASISIENALLARESEVNRIKDEFLATLSHELRTPLTAIMGWTQLLREPQVVAQKLEHGLDVIDRNTRAQTKLIDDLLDVSRIRTGKLTIQREALTLPALVQGVVDAARPAAATRGQTLSLDIENNELSVYADADRLAQAFSNLLSNAIKFTPTGGRVMVGVRRVGAAVQLTVTDTGAGISRAFLPYVFDRFSQADSSSTRAHGGLGLGLTIVRHIVELHGGQVAAESAGEGLGSTFTLTLPILEVGGRSERDGRRAVNEGAPIERVTLQGVHVLVVEDEVDSRELITAVIERAGASVTACSSVTEAFQSIDAGVPTVIVSDIAMPGYDGLTFMRRLRGRAAGQGGTVPSIALTAYAREEDRQAALAAGFHRHMSKPVEPTRLVFAIAELANGGSGVSIVSSNKG